MHLHFFVSICDFRIISDLFHDESYLEIYKHSRVFDKYIKMLIAITAEFNVILELLYNCQLKPNWIQWPFYPDLGSTNTLARCFRSILEVQKC